MPADYLEPYKQAVRTGGTGFESLLWRSRAFQETRFKVLCEVAAAGLSSETEPASLKALDGRVVADMGCGRADMLAWLVAHRVDHRRYFGVEAITDLAEACRERIKAESLPEAEIIESDFASDTGIFGSLVRNRGVELFFFSGSLNTFEQDRAQFVIERAWAAVHEAGEGGVGGVVFNFLSDLVRDPPSEDTGPARRFDTMAMLQFAASLSGRVSLRHDYLQGHDATIGMFV